MTNLRDIRRKARRDLHALAQIPALYIAAPGDAGVPVTVRVHTKFDALGMEGADGGARRREAKPKIIFLRDQLTQDSIQLKRNGVVSVDPGEAYVLELPDAPDDITITWFVTVLPAADAAGLPVPGDADG